MIRLVRFFHLVGVIAVAVITVAVTFYRQDEVRRLIEFAESQNVTLARSLANTIWPRFSPYVIRASRLDGNTLRTRPETRQIGESLKAVSTGLPILKIKIYNLDGLTVFSSEPAEIGEDQSTNLGFLSAARQGKPASKLTFHDTLSSFSGTVSDRDLVESYLSIRQAGGPVEGVFEIYTDVTPMLARVRNSTLKLGIGFVAVFGLLYGALFLIVRGADRTIKRQYADISEKNSALQSEVEARLRFGEALKKAHDELEHRVEERTSELTEEIAERKRAEEQARRHRAELAHVGRVVVMGEMATTLAHELNQPMTVISGCAQVCLDKLGSKRGKIEDLRDPVEQVAEQAERANEIIRRVRGFIRKGKEERSEVDVNQAIQGLADLLRSDASEHQTAIDMDLADSLPPVWADTIQVQQVLLNLAHNGMEAMGDREASRRRLTIRTRRSGNRAVEVSVGDSGPGIPAATLERVFDPFFTTKPDGLGMGLAISRTIVEGHGGGLSVTSDGENGTVFRFTLPAAGNAAIEDGRGNGG